MENTIKFEKFSFGKRLKSMLKVDFRRMFKSKLFYILIACALVMPILMTVMMSMMDGSVSFGQSANRKGNRYARPRKHVAEYRYASR